MAASAILSDQSASEPANETAPATAAADTASAANGNAAAVQPDAPAEPKNIIENATEIVQPVDLGMLQKLRENLTASVDFAELGIVIAVLVASIFVSHMVGVAVAKRVSRFIDGHAETEEPLKHKLLLNAAAGILRYAVLTIATLIALKVWDWQFLSELFLGFTFAFAMAAFVYKLLRALRLGFWTGAAASIVIFAFMFSSSIRDVKSMSSLLDQASFTIGENRFSLLTAVNIILVAIFLVALVRFGRRAVSLLLNRNPDLDEGQRLLGEKLAMVVLVIGAFFIGIDMLGIDLTAFAVFSGAFGLAVGFGMQKTFGNLIAGIILLWDRSVKPGDVIAVGDSFGRVNKIGIRAVSIITRDSKEHLIPNENLMTEEVENWSYSSKNVRIHIPVGVSYNSDMDHVEQLMMEAVGECERVLKRPMAKVWMAEYGDSSVNFEILCWIRDPEEGVGNVRSEVLKRLWKSFKEHDIEIPFPQRDINFRNAIPKDTEAAEAEAAIEAAHETGPERTRKPKAKRSPQ